MIIIIKLPEAGARENEKFRILLITFRTCIWTLIFIRVLYQSQLSKGL